MSHTVSKQEVDQLAAIFSESDVAAEVEAATRELFETESDDERRRTAHAVYRVAEQNPAAVASHIELLASILAEESDAEARRGLAMAAATSARAIPAERLDDARASVREALAQSETEAVRGSLVQLLGIIAGRQERAEAAEVDAAIELLGASRSLSRYQALQYLATAARFGVDLVAPVTDRLVEFAEDGTPSEQEAAYRALRWVTAGYPDRLSRAKLEELAVAGLDATDEAVLTEAVRMAASLLASGDLDVRLSGQLVETLDHPDEDVRRAAYRAVLTVGREAPSVFDRPAELADTIESTGGEEFDLREQYGEQYEEALRQLRSAGVAGGGE
jgi:hypothetical protein